jgi:FtsZ-interacting cell division protein YlmF
LLFGEDLNSVAEVLNSMMSLVNKLKNWVTGDPFEGEDYYEGEEYGTSAVANQPQPEATLPQTRNNLKVLSHPSSARSQQVVVIEPRAFNESLDIVHHLKMSKSVILNLHLLDSVQSQRVVDFLSGATHALEGNQQRIGEGVFIFTPNTVSIASERAVPQEEGLTLSNAYWN